MMHLISEDELYHHGVKGQKWGVRRYQNEDGTLTDKGKKRYGYDLDINDTSRTNVAKIRRGEARRRLDEAKDNNASKDRQAQLKKSVRSANRAVTNGRHYDAGAKVATKGNNQASLLVKEVMTQLAVNVAATGVTTAAKALQQSGRISEKTRRVLAVGSQKTVQAAGAILTAKYQSDSRNLSYYNRAKNSGRGSIKNVGGEEYEYRKNNGNSYS